MHAFRSTESTRALIGRATLVVCALLAPAVNVHAQPGERVTLKGREISVYNLAGRLHVTGGSGAATATITRHGRDASKLSIVTSVIRGRESLRVLYPDDNITFADAGRRRMRTDLQVRDDGTFGNDDDRSSGNRSRTRWSDGRRVHITSDRGGLEASADVDVQVPDGTSLRVHLAVGDIVVTNVNGDIGVEAHGGDVTVSDVKGSLDVDTGSGRASVTNITGDVSLDTGSGDVTGRNINGSRVIMNSGSGTVVIDGCSADKISMDTGSGTLRMTGLRTRTISLDTGSGDVELGLLTTPDAITIDSGSGNVTLTLPANFAATLSVETGSGRVTSDFPMQVSGKSRDYMTARIGTGGGRVSIESGSGNVRLLKGN